VGCNPSEGGKGETKGQEIAGRVGLHKKEKSISPPKNAFMFSLAREKREISLGEGGV